MKQINLVIENLPFTKSIAIDDNYSGIDHDLYKDVFKIIGEKTTIDPECCDYYKPFLKDGESRETIIKALFELQKTYLPPDIKIDEGVITDKTTLHCQLYKKTWVKYKDNPNSNFTGIVYMDNGEIITETGYTKTEVIGAFYNYGTRIITITKWD